MTIEVCRDPEGYLAYVVIWGCAIILGTFFGVAPGFLGTFWAIPGFLGIIFWLSRIFGCHFMVKFDFFRNNPDFGVLILIFPSTINDIVECSLQGSCFYDSTVLVSVLLCLCKEFHIVYNCYQFEFVYL